jgi:hypothetical protein
MPALLERPVIEQPAISQQSYTPSEAKKLIETQCAPDEMQVNGVLDFSDNQQLKKLPKILRCTSLNISNCSHLLELPEVLECNDLIARDLNIYSIKGQIKIKYRADFSGCTSLQALPENFKAGSLLLNDCTSLTALPEGIDVYFLDIAGCSQLTRFPTRGSIEVGHLIAKGCNRLLELPEWLKNIAQLDVSGCERITRLPSHLRISSWLDLADSGLVEAGAQMLPDARTPLRWRGVQVNQRIVFAPETISAQEVLETRNTELRRVMLERMTHEKFLLEVNAEVLDQDRDTGGVRKLLRVNLEDDEALVAIWVICPSTDRNYVLRVPPTMKTCRQAAAWIAGFDNTDDYAPIKET